MDSQTGNDEFWHFSRFQKHGKTTGLKQEPNNCNINSELTKTLPESSTKEKPFGCKICDSDFAYQDELDGHVASIHKGNVSFICEKKTLQCVKCDACFKTNFALKRHVEKAHVGKKLFNLDTCSTKFPRKPKLEGHFAAVHEEKNAFNILI